jgi:hypothetical protein
MSDEVSDFLRSVELLKERREEEDEARSRELEEKILQEKKERQARRAGTPIVMHFYPPWAVFCTAPTHPSNRRIGTRTMRNRAVCGIGSLTNRSPAARVRTSPRNI